MTAAIAVGALALLVPLEPAARGLTTAAIMCVVFTATAWFTGPRWLRALVREEPGGDTDRPGGTRGPGGS